MPHFSSSILSCLTDMEAISSFFDRCSSGWSTLPRAYAHICGGSSCFLDEDGEDGHLLMMMMTRMMITTLLLALRRCRLSRLIYSQHQFRLLQYVDGAYPMRCQLGFELSDLHGGGLRFRSWNGRRHIFLVRLVLFGRGSTKRFGA